MIDLSPLLGIGNLMSVRRNRKQTGATSLGDERMEHEKGEETEGACLLKA